MTPVTYATALYRNLLRLNGLGYLFRNVSIGMTDHGDVRNRGFLLKIKCDSVTVLRNVRQKFKTLNLKDKSVARIFCRTLHGSTQNEHNNNIHDIDYITFTNCDNDTCKILRNELLLLPNFVSEEEEKQVVLEVEPYLKRLRYESSHWDDAIHQYRETEKLKWSEKNAIIIQRIRDVAFPQGVKQISFVHVLDLKKEGFIKPHVDAVKFCGNTVAGLSLLSSSVMRFVNTDNKAQFFDVLLERRSLYIMKDTARYKYTHEILKDEESVFKGKHIPRDRRIAVICRNEP